MITWKIKNILYFPSLTVPNLFFDVKMDTQSFLKIQRAGPWEGKVLEEGRYRIEAGAAEGP